MKIKISDDKKHVAKMRKLIKENEGYCVCGIIKSEETKCPCREFMGMDHLGLCSCGLYEKTEV